MGLDMYLKARKYAFEHSDPELVKELNNLSCARGGITLNAVEGEAMYWRKANAIHAWFVRNVQDGEDDCKQYYVSDERLIELRDLCRTVLDDRTQASELLPPQSGFFFGSTDIDEGYWHDIQYTHDTLSNLINSPAFSKWDYYYQSSW